MVSGETVMDKTSHLLVLAKERGESSFLFIRRDGGLVWAFESTTAKTEADLMEEYRETKARKEKPVVVKTSTEVGPEVRQLWDHIVRAWDVRVPRLALPWTLPCGQKKISEG